MIGRILAVASGDATERLDPAEPRLWEGGSVRMADPLPFVIALKRSIVQLRKDDETDPSTPHHAPWPSIGPQTSSRNPAGGADIFECRAERSALGLCGLILLAGMATGFAGL
ncbi:hypothetical protein ACWGM0_19445 (plasmid) [Sphingomonas bisphenolicum]